MERRIFKGRISIGDETGLCVGGDILSSELEDISGSNVSVRFSISDTDINVSELEINKILAISGSLYANYGIVSSEYTGYLWTNDDLEIGNHDLIEDLSQHDGKYCYLEVDIHPTN